MPDVAGFDKCFDYLIPPEMEDSVRVGSIVRISLQHRSVRGFVLDIDTKASEFTLLPIEKFLSLGPPPEVVELCRFGASLYCGGLRPFLVSAKPPVLVKSPATPAARPKTPAADVSSLLQESPLLEKIVVRLRTALEGGVTLLEIPPLLLRSHVMLLIHLLLREKETGAADGHPDRTAPGKTCLVLTAFRKDARNLSAYLRKRNIGVADIPGDWAAAASGAEIVLGNRRSVLAPVRDLGAVVVFDAHHEAYQEERTPTWKATRLAVERARAAGAACILISPIPAPEPGAQSISLPKAAAVGAWPYVQVMDRRPDDPRTGLYSPALRSLVDARLKEEPDMPAVFFYNRKGRDRLLACQKCGEVVRCEFCRGACEVTGKPKKRNEVGGEREEPFADAVYTDFLSCKLCGRQRPKVCAACGSTGLSTIQPGVNKVAGELSSLLGRQVNEITADSPAEAETGRVLIGTEAVLYAVRRASVVVFLDIDQDLLRPKYKSGEKVLSQLASAARLLTPRSFTSGERNLKRRIVIQTRIPDHPVILAAAAGDPSLFWEQEKRLREQLRLPPYSALALVSGSAAKEAVRELEGRLEVAEYGQGSFLLRAKDEEELALILKEASLPRKNVKVSVDPNDV